MSLVVNEGKDLVRETSAGKFERYGIRTRFVNIGDDYIDFMREYALPEMQEGDIISISEKIIDSFETPITQINVTVKDETLEITAK